MKTIVKLPLRRYSTTELAPHYGKSPRQFRRELALVKYKYGKLNGQKWEIPQIEMIFADFGRPDIEIEEEKTPNYLSNKNEAA